MLRIGITGGIGSGKSTVTRLFSVLGAPVYDADSAAKRLMETNEALKNELISIFGAELYTNGKLNRAWLSKKVFGNKDLLHQLNAAVHPVTINDAKEWMEKCTFNYAIKEAALIFESGSEKTLDLVIGVSSPLELRIKRVQARDNTTRESILNRMKGQMNEEEKLARCHFIIQNDEHSMLIPQVVNLHNRFMSGQIN